MNILDRFSLRDQVIVLTGGSGLYGRQMTSAIAEAGAKLVIASRNLSRLQQVAAEENKRGYEVVCEAFDQGDEKSILDLRDRIVTTFGRVDGLVNIGSIQGIVGPNVYLYEGTNLGTPPPDYFFHKAGMINLTRYYASVLG